MQPGVIVPEVTSDAGPDSCRVGIGCHMPVDDSPVEVAIEARSERIISMVVENLSPGLTDVARRITSRSRPFSLERSKVP